MSAKSFGQYTEYASFNQIWGWYDVVGNGIYNIYNDNKALEDFINYTSVGGDPVEELGAYVESDHLAEFTASAGLNFNIPLNDRFSDRDRKSVV